jgi:hypothetical protein
MSSEWQVCPRCRGPIGVYPRRPLDDVDRACIAEGMVLLGAYCLSDQCGWKTTEDG